MPEDFKQLVSSGQNKTIIQIILQFISFANTYYINFIQFHNICIPDLTRAHRENCQQIQRPTGHERDIVMADIQDWPKFTEFQETEPMETTSGGGGDGGMQGIKSKVCNITYNSNKFITFHIILTIPSHFQYSSLQPYRHLLPRMTSPVYKKLQEAQLGQAQVTLCIELFSCNQNKSLCTSTCHFHTCCTFTFLFLGTGTGYQAATSSGGRGGTQHQQ